jgi:hypothetical protein
MRAFLAITAAGLALAGSIGLAVAQPYGGYGGGPGYGPGPGRGYDYDDRGPRRDYDRRDYDRRGGGYAFDEREYLRCNPDVRRAVRNGQMASGAAHYQEYGRRERRALSC